MVADITAYGRPAELRRERTGVNGLLEECLALVQDRVAERSIRVIADLGDAVGALALDARELHKAFLNLVVNAIDAMEPGGTLTVRSRRGEDGKVEILVEDTGCGMDEETRAHIFELFFTTKPSGTGLGMSIVRSAMERHGGQVEVDSAPGRGTRVRVVLPPDERRRRTELNARNYVASTVTDPGLLGGQATTLAANIVAGRSIGTNALFVTVNANAPSTGQTAGLGIGQSTILSTSNGAVNVTVDVKSPLWAEFDKIQFFVNAAPQAYDHDNKPTTRNRYRALPSNVCSPASGCYEKVAGTDFTISTVNDFQSIPGAQH